MSSRLFTPVSIGSKKVHRIALSPLTRLRNSEGTQIPQESLAPVYYAQRASPGGLLITEATFIAREAGGYPRAPGIYSKEQIEAWKKVTDAVHEKGGFIFQQLWALGRANADPPLHDHMPDIKTVAPSPIPLKGKEELYTPEELTIDDIKRYVQHYAQAARNAIEAGMDGVEIHGANGYLIDQFTQEQSNTRTDAYGGSIENRTRFALEVVEAVVDAIGAEKVGIRFSPWGTFQDMLMPNPLPTFTYLLSSIISKHPKLGYVHFTESVSWGPNVVDDSRLAPGIRSSNDPFRAIVRGMDPAKDVKADDSTVFPDPDEKHPTVFISANGYTPENIYAHSERTGDVCAVGRLFTSNPDLPRKIQEKIPVVHYDRNTFYSRGAHGYIDFPAAAA